MTNWKVLLKVLVLWVFCYSYSNTAQAEVNQYGVDCSVTPWMSSCGDEWKTQDGMTEYSISDDGRVQVDLPFTFPFYGNNYTTSWMYSNGVVGFMSPTGSFCCNGIDVLNGDFTNYTGLPYFSYSIAALWTDLIDLNVDIDGDGVDDTGFFTQEVDTNNDGTVDTLRYLWRNISEYYNNQTANTFGTQIDVNGGIEIHHFDIDIRNHSVTVGVFGDVRDGSQIEQYEYYAYSSVTDYTNSEYEVHTFNLGAACQANPLISPTCDGYANAYAELVYQQNCAADPLYDSGCSGYEAAYLDQQCNLDALYDTSCDGYEQAYYEEYIQPTLEQQANEAAGVDDGTNTATTSTTSNTDNLVVQDPVESITNVEVTGDAFVDEILRDNTNTGNNDFTDFSMPEIEMELDMADSMPTDTQPTTEEANEEPETEMVASLEMEIESEERETESNNIEEPVEESESNESNEVSETEQSDEQSDSGETKKTSGKTDEEKKKSKREKIKEIAKKKAMKLAEDMSNAASFEAQQAVQLQVLRLIGFNPDFSAYQNVNMNEVDFYADVQLPDGKIPNSKFGARNGLAQQLLWDKMVDEQYNRK